MRTAVIIPAAGMGKRLPGKVSKQFLDLNGHPVISWTVNKFLNLDSISAGVLVVQKDELDNAGQVFNSVPNFKQKFKIVIGGAHRQDSVFNGLSALSDKTEIVLVHDGVRPLVSPEIITECIRIASDRGACITAVPAKDTIKRVQDGWVQQTIPREQVWQVQTPQGFRYELLYQAHQQARQMNYYATDEAALLEWLGIPVAVIKGEYRNIKITTQEDLVIAKSLLEEKRV